VRFVPATLLILIISSTSIAERLPHQHFRFIGRRAYSKPELASSGTVGAKRAGKENDPDSPLPGRALAKEPGELIYPSSRKINPPSLPPSPAAAEPSGEPSISNRAPARSTKTVPDGFTRVDYPTPFNATFNPTVAPFKRFDVKDAVAPDFSLKVADSATRAIPVHHESDPLREQFSASILVQARRGVSIPIPSVAAGSRLLSNMIRPAVRARFSRDSAENWVVRLPRSGFYRIDFLVDAPYNYFNAPITDVSPSSLRGFARPSLPAAVAAWARKLLGWLGINRKQSLKESLNKLVGYLRSFTLGPVVRTSSQKELLTKLFIARRGVCRHRAHLMTILAQGLGLPARYVTNETHAFNEVYLPSTGWRRIDLGGASPLIMVRNSVGKRTHRAAEPDPFPIPIKYNESRSSESGILEIESGSGLEEYLNRKGKGKGSGPRPGKGMGGPDPEIPGEGSKPDPAHEESQMKQWSKLWKELKWKGPLNIMSQAPSIALRGGSIVMTGKVDGEGAGKVRRLVIVLKSLNGTRHLRLGYAEVRAKRSFSVKLPILPNLPAGRYWLHVIPIKK